MVADAVSIMVRGPDKTLYQAAADPAFTGDVRKGGPDLALVEIIGGAFDVPPIGLGAVNRDSPAGDPIEDCHVIGYPASVERETDDGSRLRETAEAVGRIAVLSGLAGGLLSVQVSAAPEPLSPAYQGTGNSPWSGMSGAPVVAEGLLLGVVTEHMPRAGSSTISVTPLTALEADPAHPGWGTGVADPGAWWIRLGVDGARVLTRLPSAHRPSRSAYWATVQEIRHRTGKLVGRQRELAEIASFATGDEGYRLLVGEPWAGKTALLAEAVATMPGDVDVICYFLSRREGSADSSRFLTAVVAQLASLLNEDAAAGDLTQFWALWHLAVERANTTKRHLLLVVDGLDEDSGREPPSVATVLPSQVGGCVHVLVSGRMHTGLLDDLPLGHPLRQTPPRSIQPFSGGRQLEILARQEIEKLLKRDDDGLAVDVMGLLAAAAGPLAVRDLAAMTVIAPPSADLTHRIRQLVTESAARSLQHSSLAGDDRYQFAHESLLARAQHDLNDPDFRRRIHSWAERWQAAGWPAPAGGEGGTPHYLLDTYQSTLAGEPQRLVRLASYIGWVETAIGSAGVDLVMADLRRAVAANPENAAVAAIYATVVGQAYNLRPPLILDQPGYILRQLWTQAAELAQDDLAEAIRSRLMSQAGPRLVPMWTTRRASRALSGELGRHHHPVAAVAVLADGRVVSGGADGHVLAWDPTRPGAAPTRVGRHRGAVNAVAELADGHVVTGGADGQILTWDSDDPGAIPAEAGRHRDAVAAVAVLGGRWVIAGGYDGQLLVWDATRPRAGPARLSQHAGAVRAVTVLTDGRIATVGGHDGQVWIWDLDHPGVVPVGLGRHDTIAYAMAVLADGRVVTVGGYDGQILVRNPHHPETRPDELGRHGCVVRAVAELKDGRVVTGGDDGRVLVWDPAGTGVEPSPLGAHDSTVRAVAELKDGRVVTGGDDGRVLVWDPAGTGVEPSPLDGHYGTVRAVAELKDGRVVTGGDDGRVLVWDPAGTGVEPSPLGAHDSTVRAVAELKDGRVVTGGDDRLMVVWNPNRNPTIGPVGLVRYDTHEDDRYDDYEGPATVGPIYAMAVLADGRVVTGGYGEPLVIVGDDGRVITSEGDGQVLMWAPARPGTRPVDLGRDRSPVKAVAALENGQVVTGSDDLRVWDPDRPGMPPTELGGDDGPIYAVAGLADDRVVTGGFDGCVLMWDLTRPGAPAVKLGEHEGSVLAVAELAERVVSGGEDGRVLVWEPAASSGYVIQLRCSVTALATRSSGPAGSHLIIAHQGGGFSLWLFANDPDEADSSRSVRWQVRKLLKFGRLHR